MSFFPITSSKSLVDARIDYVFLLVLEKILCIFPKLFAHSS